MSPPAVKVAPSRTPQVSRTLQQRYAKLLRAVCEGSEDLKSVYGFVALDYWPTGELVVTRRVVPETRNLAAYDQQVMLSALGLYVYGLYTCLEQVVNTKIGKRSYVPRLRVTLTVHGLMVVEGDWT